VGRLSIGRLFGAPIKRNEQVMHYGAERQRNVRAQLLYTWRGLRRVEVTEATPGDIIAVAGIEDITVGDTLAGGEEPKALKRVKVDEPTIGMTFAINTSPFSGKDGKFLTARQIRDRLDRELLSNVSLRIEETPSREAFKVFGRGELQLAILVEQMRREGFELTLSRPEVVRRETDEGLQEPYELAHLDVPDDAVGTMTQKLSARKGVLVDMVQDGSGRSRLVYRIPARGLIGFRGEFLTDTRGEGLINTLFDGWDVDQGHMLHRSNGGLVADRTGATTTYALFKLQPRARKMFCGTGEDVYEGMIIGEHIRENDLNVDCTKAKQLTNFRSAGADEKQVLAPKVPLTLERAMEFIDEDELIEVTPNHIRLRKRILATNKRSIVRREKKVS
jgi:GTP-binding protein